MKKISIFIICLMTIIVTSCNKEVYVYSSFHEPANEGLRYLWSNDGRHWDSIPGVWLKPMIGIQKVMRDPSIQRTPDGVYRFVWTSSWHGDRGFGYSSSRDLIHWTQERFIEVMKDTSTVNVWAPELFWDDTRQEMMIVWSSCVPFKFEKGLENERNNHRLYYTTTKDFSKFSQTKLLYDPGFSCIDATIVKMKEKQYVMVLKDNTRNSRNIKVAFASDPQGPWSKSSDSFTEMYSEGPTVAKVKDGYIIYYDRYRNKDFGAQFTRDFKNFTDISNQVSIPPLHKHGTIFYAPKKLIKKLCK